MDQGVPKIRRKQSNGFEPVEGQMIMTKAQLTTLRDYFTNTLEEGTLTFDFDDPISGTTATARFAEPPSWTSTANPAYYSVSLSFIFIL